MREVIDLSILVCTTSTRVGNFLPKCVESLAAQATGRPVEILYLGDNKRRSVGHKRNDLISLAQGKYFAFVDDDDEVSTDYVATILQGLRSNPDVFCFRAVRFQSGKKDSEVIYDINFPGDSVGGKPYKRLPNHLMVWRKELVEHVKFEEVSYGEDGSWAQQLKGRGLVRRQVITKQVLYKYLFDPRTTETQNFS